MRLLAVRSRSWRTATLGALALAALVVCSLPGIALATTRSGSTIMNHSPRHVDVVKVELRTGSHEIRNKASRARQLPSLRSAGRFLLIEIRQKVTGDWARAWESLYPPHQRIAPRDTFIRCETATPFPVPLESIHVVQVRAASVRAPGARRAVPGVAVTLAVELRWYGPRDPITFRHTFHLVPVQGHWRWLLSRDRYRLYTRGACLTRPAS